MFITEKRNNVSIKYGSFCKKNFLAPLDIKLSVLNTCAKASLIYSCETWGGLCFKSAETAYRQGLKTALSIRDSINNEVVYLESGSWPLQINIAKQQIKFWMSLKKLMDDKPLHYLSNLINTAAVENISYIRYYENLITK